MKRYIEVEKKPSPHGGDTKFIARASHELGIDRGASVCGWEAAAEVLSDKVFGKGKYKLRRQPDIGGRQIFIAEESK